MYPQGRMSHHFREMREGDYLAVKGPKVKLLPSEIDCLQFPSMRSFLHAAFQNPCSDSLHKVHVEEVDLVIFYCVAF
jgi:hypothetical protein